MEKLITFAIPCYNSEAYMENCIKSLLGAGDDTEILIINDGSKDGCDKIVEDMNLPNVRVVGYPNNQGKGCAVRTAVLAAEGDIVMFTDADLAYGTEVIKRVYDAFMEAPETDMVIGSRNLNKDGYEGYTFIRKLASKTYIKVLCFVGGFKLSDSQCGCKAFTRETAQQIFPHCEVNGFAFDFEAILWATKLKKKIKEIPVKIINHRESKVHVVSDTFKMLKDLRKMKKRIKRIEIEVK